MNEAVNNAYRQYAHAIENDIRNCLGLDYDVKPSTYDIDSITVLWLAGEGYVGTFWVNAWDGVGCA